MSKPEKKLLAILLLATVSAGVLSACSRENKPSPPSVGVQVLGGEHILRKMTERTESQGKISGSFFLFFGDLSGTSSTKTLVKFAWLMNNGQWAISSLPLEKIRIKTDEHAETPTIKFRWGDTWDQNRDDIQRMMDEVVIYALVTVRPDDWPIDIQLPLNKK